MSKYKNYKDIKSVEDACEYLGYPTAAITVIGAPAHLVAVPIANYGLDVVHEACNKLANGGKNWVADYNNYKQWKYSPVWDMETYNDAPPGSGFVLRGVNCVSTHSSVGARRDCISEEVCRYICTQFIDLFRITHKL